MAADTRHDTTLGTRLRFLARLVAATGLLVAAVGATLLASELRADLFKGGRLQSALNGADGGFARNAAWTVVAGLAAVGVWALVELGGLVGSAGGRTAAGTSSAVATAAAVTLLVFVNAYSFTHHKRYDFTRDRHLTLPPEIADKLRTLRQDAPTTIVVLQMHKAFGGLSDVRDVYTSEAERKVTEKVKDLVDLFREFGPRFNVVVLDTETYEYDGQLADLTKDAPELKAAIESAPENSIFFHANKRVQRLAFDEFLQLDKTASKEANGGRGNLVLLPQGIDRFARRVLAVEEVRPKVALCVVHELLTSAYPEGRGRVYTLAGMREALTDHGYDVVDIVLKKGWAGAESLDDLKPAADTREESKLERLQGDLGTARLKLAAATVNVLDFDDIQKDIRAVENRPWAERDAVYRRHLPDRLTGSEAREPEALAWVAERSAKAAKALAEAKAKVAEADEKVRAALRDERTTEDRRIADARAKLAQKLAGVDLLVVPRFTVEDVTEGERPDVPPELHALRKEQVEVVKEFMAAGKPVLAFVGPINTPLPLRPRETQPQYEERLDARLAADQDGFEKLLAERGIELGRETILFDGEGAAFAARLAGDQFGGGVPTDIPPLTIAAGPAGRENPVAAAAALTARSAGKPLELRAKALRPVYLADGWQDRTGFAAEFAFTSKDCWNERRPFLQTQMTLRETPTGELERVLVVTNQPQFEETAGTNPRWGTRAAERNGPFPVGVAIESAPPAYWSGSKFTPERGAALAFAGLLPGQLPFGQLAALAAAGEETRPAGTPGRLVVFGSGNLFSGPDLKPAQEKLLLHSVNWLTGRTDRLPRADLPEWKFPRVSLTDRDRALWSYGTVFGLPLVALYLGFLVMMVRRRR